MIDWKVKNDICRDALHASLCMYLYTDETDTICLYLFSSTSLAFFTINAIPNPSAASCRFRSLSSRVKIFFTTASISSLDALPFQVIYFLISCGVRSYMGIVCLRNSIHRHPLAPYTNSAFVWLRAVKNNFSNHTAVIGYCSSISTKKSVSSTILANWSFLDGFFWDCKITHDVTTCHSLSISPYHSLRIPGSIHRYIYQSQ